MRELAELARTCCGSWLERWASGRKTLAGKIRNDRWLQAGIGLTVARIR